MNRKSTFVFWSLKFAKGEISKGKTLISAMMLVLGILFSQNAHAQSCSMSATLTPPSWNGSEFCTGYNPSAIAAPTISYTGSCSGTPSYNYAWRVRVNGGSWSNVATGTGVASVPGYDPPSQVNTPAASPLKTVEYQLTVNDVTRSLQSITTNVSVIIGSTMTTSSVASMSCTSPANGTIDLTVNGGLTSKTYSWATTGLGNIPSGQEIVQDPSGLTAASYTVTVSSGNCPTVTTAVTISGASNLTASISSSTNVACYNGNDGQASVTASGGIPSYTYAWSPGGGSGTTASSLTAGTYTVQVTDAGSCTVTTSVNITQPPSGISASASVTATITCYGGNSGEITASSSGGAGSPTYQINNGGYGVSNIFSNLTAGTYTINAKDANGCVATTTATITQLGLMSATVNSSNCSCNGGSDGSISISSPTGGSGTYEFRINGGAWQSSGSFFWIKCQFI